MRRVVSNIYFKVFFILMPILCFSSFANAQTNEQEQIPACASEISSAILTQDNDLIASIVANAINNDPDLSECILTYIVSKYPSASPAIVRAVQSISPENAENVFSIVTSQLEEYPENEAILAQVLTQINPAGRGRGSLRAVENTSRLGITLPDVVSENPSTVSPN
ncbi:MAG: hypothetical protein O2970_11395 [Proteobacteria bacterium]|nr:hypothetical protein [Pseudomonadota bacterium]